MPGEVWADAKLDGQFLKGVRVSTMGRVQRPRRKAHRRSDSQKGRHKVKLWVDGKLWNVFVYVLMAHTLLRTTAKCRAYGRSH